MGKKLLVILGLVAVAGYVFRDRIITGAVNLVEKANSLFADDASEEDLEYLEARNEQ